MRRILLALSTTAVALALLFGYRTSAPPAPAIGTVTAAAGTDSTTGGSLSSGEPAAAGGATTTPSKTYAGSVADTRWGPVQVQITVSGGKVTAADVLQVPSGNQRDIEINSYAVPILNSEVVAAQSASIDTVSGATVTSVGYISSLQAALDAASLS